MKKEKKENGRKEKREGNTMLETLYKFSIEGVMPLVSQFP